MHVALFVLYDEGYRDNVWCDEKMRGIQDEANRRREKLRFFTDVAAFESAASKLDADSSVIVLFDAISYIQRIAPVLARLKVHPIFSGLVSGIRLPFQFSCVSPDMDASCRMIAEYLAGCGKMRIAEVGINKNSWSDVSRSEALGRYARGEGHRVFYAAEDLADSYRAFLAERKNFDAVICTTDHITIALIEYLKEHGAYDPEQFFISYGDTTIARLYGEGITSVTVNYYDCGKAAVETHFNRLKYNWSAVTVLLNCSLQIRGSTGNMPYLVSEKPPIALDLHPMIEPIRFRVPTRIIGRIERLLSVSDIADLRLLYCMLEEYSYEKTGEFCFMSAEAAKYRIRKIRETLQVESKAEAVALIRKYIRKENLLAVIEEKEKGTS